jgi:hypothetical protein
MFENNHEQIKKIDCIENLKRIYETTTLLNGEKYDLQKMYDKGYSDAIKNRDILDKIFINNNNI